MSDEMNTSLGEGQEPIHSEPRATWASAIAMAEAGLLTDVSIVFVLAWIYVPVLGMAFIPLVPTPFSILYRRRGPRISFFAACVAGFLMTVLVGPHYGWRLTLEAVIGIAIGWAMERRWSPYFTMLLALFVNATVAYVAAFGAVYALGLPLHDLYLELRNLLLTANWTLNTAASLFGVQSEWLSVRPWFVAFGHFSLVNWIPMFYVYVVALDVPVILLYYSVASTTAFALGHDVRPFPPRWAWSVMRLVGIVLSPLFWLVRMLWAFVTAPVWGPVWVARTVSRKRRERRLHVELAALPTGETDTKNADMAGVSTTSAQDAIERDPMAASNSTAREP